MALLLFYKMITQNLVEVRKRIKSSCAKIGRDPEEIRLVVVTKGRSPKEIKEAIEAGITDIGENKVQEALQKYKYLAPSTYNLAPIKWHMVGHLQTNKVKEAVRIFDLIQSVDSLKLALEIDKQAAKIGKIQDVLIQVNVASELSKFGLKPDETIAVIEKIRELKNINLKGLMAIASLADNPEQARPCFTMLRQLRDKINQAPSTKHPAPILSMGMSDDFEVAIEEGSNMVRLGRVVFEG